MNKVLKIHNSPVPRSIQYINNSKCTYINYLFAFVTVIFLLFISGYKNELPYRSQKNEMASKTLNQEGKVRWLPFQGGFKPIYEIIEAGTDTYPIPKGKLTGRSMDTTSIDNYSGGDIINHFPGIVSSMNTLFASNGDIIFQTGWGYVQETKFTKVFIYLF
jgi:hypothetical protein